MLNELFLDDCYKFDKSEQVNIMILALINRAMRRPIAACLRDRPK
jgi:hypothetical protein